MKKVFTTMAGLLMAALALPTVAAAQSAASEPAIAFKSARGTRDKEADRYVQVYLKSSVAGEKFYVVVDGDSTEYDMVKAATLYNKKIAVTKPEVDVKIYGKTISFINFGYTDAYDVTIGADGNNTITEFRCESNPITSIDFVNGMKALTYLVLNNNKKLTSINIKNDALERVKLGKQNSVKTFAMEGAKIYEFNLTNNNGIETIDLSKCPAMQSVTLTSDSTLKSVKFNAPTTLKTITITSSKLTSFEAKGLTALTTLALTGNHELSAVTIEDCPVLGRINLGSNNLESFSLSAMPKLTYLSIDSNPFKSLNLDLDALTTLYCEKTALKSADFSKLPKVKTLYARNGVLESIKLSDEALKNTLSNLYVSGNNFNLVNLPPRGPKMKPSKSYTTPYNYYAPQKNPTLPKVINVGEKVDLSGYLYGHLYDTTAVVNSEYKWVTKFDEELQAGVDYTVKDGVFTFLREQEDSVACFVTNSEFPWFKTYSDNKGTYDYRIATNYVVVTQPTGIDAATTAKATPVATSTVAGEISVRQANGATVMIADIAGRVVAREAVADQKAFAVPSPGIYIVVVGDKRFKVKVK